MRGFTLIELLVVVAMIALLIALLTPALENAIQSAENVRCAANLKAIGQGVDLYLFDAKRRYPRTQYFGMLLGNPGTTGYQGRNLDTTERPLNAYLGYTSPGSRVPVAQCPSDKGDSHVRSTNTYLSWGNSYIELTWQNWYRFKKVFGGLRGTTEPTVDSIRQSTISRMDNKVLLADWPLFGDRSYDEPTNRWHIDGIGEFDRQFSTLFADGHSALFTYPRSEIENPIWQHESPNPSFKWW